MLGILTLVLIVFVAKSDYLSDPNAIDYAQIARNLAEGKGFSTSALTPLALSTGLDAERAPDISRPPLYVSLLALAMRVGSPGDRTVVFTAVIFLLLTLILVYVIGRRFFDDGVGVYAVAVSVISTGLIAQTMSGLETSFLAFLITLLFGMLWLHSQSPKPDAMFWPALSGLLLGMCYLVRYECLALLPVVLLYWFFAVKAGRWPRMVLLAAVFLAVALPWVIRTNRITGRAAASAQSYELIMNTVGHPGQTLYRQFTDVPPLPASIALRHPLQMLRKFNEGIRMTYAGFPPLLNVFVLALFLAGLFVRPIRERYGLIQWCLVTGVFAMAIAIALYTNVLRLLLAFAPLITVFATAAFTTYMNDYARGRHSSDAVVITRWFRTLAMVGWILVLAYPMFDYLFANRPARQAPMVQVMREVAEEGDFIVTDLPWHVAWFGRKRTLLLPQSLQQLEALQQAGVRPDALYLSPELLSVPKSENMDDWQRHLLSRQPLPGFERSATWRYAGALWKSQSTTR